MDAQLDRKLAAVEAKLAAVEGEVANATIVAKELMDAPSKEAKLRARDSLLEHMRRVSAYADEVDAANLGLNTDKTRKSIADLLVRVDSEINSI